MKLLEHYLSYLYSDFRKLSKEWRGANRPFGDDSNRSNLIIHCFTLECNRAKINCLRKLRDQAAMNPFYQHRIDRFIDAITQTYEPTDYQGTIPGNEFKYPVKENKEYVGEFFGWFKRKKAKANPNTEDGSITVKFLKWPIVLGYPPDKSNKIDFYKSKIKVGERNWPTIVKILKNSKIGSGYGYNIPKSVLERGIIPIAMQMYEGTGYGGFNLYIGSDQLIKALGNHVLYFEFDQNDRMSKTYHLEG